MTADASSMDECREKLCKHVARHLSDRPADCRHKLQSPHPSSAVETKALPARAVVMHRHSPADCRHKLQSHPRAVVMLRRSPHERDRTTHTHAWGCIDTSMRADKSEMPLRARQNDVLVRTCMNTCARGYCKNNVPASTALRQHHLIRDAAFSTTAWTKRLMRLF